MCCNYTILLTLFITPPTHIFPNILRISYREFWSPGEDEGGEEEDWHPHLKHTGGS